MKLEVLGNNVNLVWGLGCFEISANLLNVDTVEEVMFLVGNTANMSRVAYAALQNGAEIEGSSLNFNVRQFQNWLNEQPEQVGVDIVEDFMKSVYQGRIMKDRYDDIIASLQSDDDVKPEPKKKVTRARKSVK